MSEWISVKEREPEQRGSILTYGGCGVVVVVWDYGCWCEPFDSRTIEFTHWMPLPEPPVGV